MNHVHQIPMEMLYGYVEGTLSKQKERSVERHLHECSECADIVDRYTRLVGEFEAPPNVAPPELLASSARLDLRMAPYLSRPQAKRKPSALSYLCGAYGIGTLLDWKDPLLHQIVWPSPRHSARPRLASASAPSAQTSLLLKGIAAMRADGQMESTTARIFAKQEDEFLGFIIELDLAYLGWEAAVAYLLGPDSELATGISLYSGLIDKEGMLEFEVQWPSARPLEVDRIRIGLLAPAS